MGWGVVAVFAGVCLVRSALYANEMSFWTAATAAEPGSGAARMNLGGALYAARDLEGAIGSYRRALELPMSAIDRAQALTNLGSVLYEKDDLPGAETLLRDAASSPGADATVNFNLGAMLYQKAYRAQESRDPAPAHAHFAEARSYLERAVAQDPYHARAWMLLGECEAEAGANERARSAWTRVLALEPAESPVARDARAALARIGGS